MLQKIISSLSVAFLLLINLQVAFNREVHTPSVTLEGDIFQPSGLLTGGSRKYTSKTLVSLSRFSMGNWALMIIDMQNKQVFLAYLKIF